MRLSTCLGSTSSECYRNAAQWNDLNYASVYRAEMFVEMRLRR